MTNTVFSREKVRRLLAVAPVVVIAFLGWTNGASAQIAPQSNGQDECREWSKIGTEQGTFRAVPWQRPLVVVNDSSGPVAAGMWGTRAEECFNGQRQFPCAASSTCQAIISTVCEYHCQHNHTPPYEWWVELRPTLASSFIAWQGDCLPIRDAPRTSCIVRMTEDRSVRAVAGSDTAAPTQPSSVAVAPSGYSATVSWSASTDDHLAGYDVRLDGAVAARTTPSRTSAVIAALACGTPYTLVVEAYDWRGNAAASDSVSFRTTACRTSAPPRPNTVIHVKPPKVTRSRTAFFHYGWTGTVKATKYQCKRDKGRWVACSGSKGKTYRRLKKGYHTFYVRAGNAAGFDRTPAKYRWRIR